MNEWNERLTFILEDAKIKRVEIASKILVDPATIHRWKTGKAFPNHAFFVSLDELVNEKTGKKINTDWIIFGRGECYFNQEPSSTGGDQDSGSHEVMQTGTVELEKAKTVNVVKEQLQQIREEFKSKMNELEQSLVAVSGKIRVAANATLQTCLQVARNQNLQLCK